MVAGFVPSVPGSLSNEVGSRLAAQLVLEDFDLTSEGSYTRHQPRT
jgi:hypothetical protein